MKDVVDQLWLLTRGEWNFENSMSEKLSAFYGFDIVKDLWLAMKNNENKSVNRIHGLKRKAEFYPARPAKESSQSCPEVGSLIGKLEKCEIVGSCVVEDVS